MKTQFFKFSFFIQLNKIMFKNMISSEPLLAALGRTNIPGDPPHRLKRCWCRHLLMKKKKKAFCNLSTHLTHLPIVTTITDCKLLYF